MAERRMFAKTIIDSDSFLDMPLSTQALYFHLSMRADDDGFINNPKKIQRMTGCSDDDMKILLVKRFLIPFDSGIVVIKHWKIHNYIQKDRYKPTIYQEEKALLDTKENKSYALSKDIPEVPDTECIHDVSSVDTQVRLGKVSLELGEKSLGEERLDNERIVNESSTTPHPPINYERIQKLFNEKCISLPPIAKMTDKRKQSIMARVREYGIESIDTVIDNASKSKFMAGDNQRNWVATFDWIIKPSNYIKVLEGNYSDKGGNQNGADTKDDQYDLEKHGIGFSM